MAKKRIFIDCSATVYSGVNTGIQRVVRNVVQWSCSSTLNESIEVIPVVVLFGFVFYIRPDLVQINKSKLISFGSQAKLTVESTRVKIRKRLSKYKYFGWFFVSFFEQWDRLLRFLYKILKYSRVSSFVILSGFVRFKPNSEDTFVFLDSFWLLDLPVVFKRSLSSCGSIQAVIYDIIPLLHPEIVEVVGCRAFSRSFHFLMGKVDKVLAISKSVAHDVESYLRSHKYDLEKMEIKHFYLGADFKPTQKETNIPTSAALKSIFQGQVWLMVGTIEPRKNHLCVIDALDEIWQQRTDVKLIIVGRIGWKCEDILDRIQSHPHFGKNLIYLKDCADEELKYCYQKASGLIFASLSEGFGLPLVEAMFYNMPVLCSDISVFREVGGEYPVYFDPKNPKSLSEKLRNFSPQRMGKRQIEVLTWKEATEKLLTQISSKKAPISDLTS